MAEGDCGAFLCSGGVAKPSFPFLFVSVCAPFHSRFGPKQSLMNGRNLNICILTRTTESKGQKREKPTEEKKRLHLHGVMVFGMRGNIISPQFVFSVLTT